MKVLIIPEDPSLDKYILKPVVERIFQDLGRTVRVDVLEDPHLTGISQALDAGTVDDVLRDNPMASLVLLMIDRDCDRFKNTSRAMALEGGRRDRLLACLAVQEVEVWMMALHRDALGLGWSAVRAECDPKERFAEPLLDRIGRNGPGRGRKGAMRALGAQWRGLLDVCPEIADLKARIERWLNGRG